MQQQLYIRECWWSKPNSTSFIRLLCPFSITGWCALKPEIFHEIYGTQCQPLECGDICLSLGASRSPSIFMQHQQQHHLTHHHVTSVSNASGNPSNVLSLTVMANGAHPGLHNHHQLNGPSGITIKMEPIDEKMVPISILPQNHHHLNLHQLQSMPNSPSNNNNNNNNNSAKKGTFVSPNPLHKNSSNSTASNKKLKRLASDIKFQTGNNSSGGGGTAGSTNSTNGVIQPPVEKVKGRRPMNAFLLFAKDKRPELIQMYPGKDNRWKRRFAFNPNFTSSLNTLHFVNATTPSSNKLLSIYFRSISVLLGEAWQSLPGAEREKYALNAKARAEEQKRIHPDCWKRKRSQSTNSQ